MNTNYSFPILTIKGKTNARSLAPNLEWAVDNNLISAAYLQLLKKNEK